jgi:hypothetical protein
MGTGEQLRNNVGQEWHNSNNLRGHRGTARKQCWTEEGTADRAQQLQLRIEIEIEIEEHVRAKKRDRVTYKILAETIGRTTEDRRHLVTELTEAIGRATEDSDRNTI